MLCAYIVQIKENLLNDEFRILLSLVSQEKKNKIIKYHQYIDSQRSLLGDILARYSICEDFNLNNADLSFNTNPYGKPAISSRGKIGHNISHAGRYIVCAVSDTPVGIDVEEIKPIDLRIAERFYSNDEYEYLTSAPTESTYDNFFQLWTMKESYIKMIGRGLSIPLNSFSVLREGSLKRVFFTQFIKNSDIIGHICSEHNSSVTYRYINVDELLAWAEIQRMLV